LIVSSFFSGRCNLRLGKIAISIMLAIRAEIRPGNAQILFVGHSGYVGSLPAAATAFRVNLRGGPQQSFARSSIRLHVHRMRSGMIA
jgi:hypothetical protein